jgi:hypothetical protein
MDIAQPPVEYVRLSLCYVYSCNAVDDFEMMQMQSESCRSRAMPSSPLFVFAFSVMMLIKL